MEDFRDAHLPVENEVEDAIVADTESVQGRVVVPPYQVDVGAGPGLDRILLKDAKFLLDAFLEVARNSS